MTVLLPNPGGVLGALIADVDQENWQQWMDRFERVNVALWLPKLRLEYELKLNDLLVALGMGVAFAPFAFRSMLNECCDCFVLEHTGAKLRNDT